MEKIVSFYSSIMKPENRNLEIENILEKIKNGFWQDEIFSLRTKENKEDRTKLKLKLPSFTVSGVFKGLDSKSIESHSGLICIDIDLEDLKKTIELEEKLRVDPFTFALFRSCSGNSLACIFKIKADLHLESFFEIEDYFSENYNLAIDKTCKNVNRQRFVSFDPELFYNNDSKLWIAKKKRKVQKTITKFTGTNEEFDYVIKQIIDQSVDITNDDYFTFRNIGFAISSKYGDSGLEYFKTVCQFSSKYNPDFCEKQYHIFCKRDNQGITINTFFYIAKQANLSITNKEYSLIKEVIRNLKKASKKKEDVYSSLLAINPDIKKKLVNNIVNEIWDKETHEDESELNNITKLELYISSKYKITRNDVKEKIFLNDKQLNDKIINNIWLDACRNLNHDFGRNTIPAIIDSDIAEEFNPILDFIEENKFLNPKGNIKRLCDSIILASTDENISDDGFLSDFKYKYVKKWLVSMFSFLDGDYSPLCLVLCGKHGVGKSWFFQYLLPECLRNEYFCQSSLDNHNTDLTLMHSFLLILNDEFGGKTVKDSVKFKELISQNYITYRKPYGTEPITKKRIALFCGTANTSEIIADMTGNRRIIPIEIDAIDNDIYNSINKDELFIEAYNEYVNGFNWRILNQDIAELERHTFRFKEENIEYELALKHLEPTNNKKKYITSTEFSAFITEYYKMRHSIKKIGMAFKILGYSQELFKRENTTVRAWNCQINYNLNTD